MSTLPLLAAWGKDLAVAADAHSLERLGALTTRLVSLRALSREVGRKLDRGADPSLEAAMVKDAGTRFENDVVDTVRSGAGHASPSTRRLLQEAVVGAPASTLRGGTNEVLRSVVARGLGLR